MLPHPGDPTLHESYVRDAGEYVRLAETMNGPIPKPVDFSYIWGDALQELERMEPDLRIINLETSVTKNEDFWKGKPVHYRMNPANIPCITAANVNYCSLANNHILDWGYAGLAETKKTLDKAGIKSAGAGGNIDEAETPAVMEIRGKGRVIVFSLGSESSGIPPTWTASKRLPGVNIFNETLETMIPTIREKVEETKRKDDFAVASIHWGPNWEYGIPRERQRLAHRLIDESGFDLIHGHSSHHVKGIEVYRDKLILYGCGDFLNDYEGIGGHELFRDDLGLMYFARVQLGKGNVLSLEMTPTQIKRFRLNQTSRQDTLWLQRTLDREGHELGTRTELGDDDKLRLLWK